MKTTTASITLRCDIIVWSEAYMYGDFVIVKANLVVRELVDCILRGYRKE